MKPRLRPGQSPRCASPTLFPRKGFSSARSGAPHAVRHLVPARPLQGGAACRPQAQARIPQRHRDLPARGDVRNHPILLGAGPAQAQPSRMRPAIGVILFVARAGIGVALRAFAAARARAASAADFDAGFNRFRRARRTRPPAQHQETSHEDRRTRATAELPGINDHCCTSRISPPRGNQRHSSLPASRFRSGRNQPLRPDAIAGYENARSSDAEQAKGQERGTIERNTADGPRSSGIRRRSRDWRRPHRARGTRAR